MDVFSAILERVIHVFCYPKSGKNFFIIWVAPNVPVAFVKEVNRNIFFFVWNFKSDKVRRKTVVRPISKGGLSMVNFSDVVRSLNIAWVNRYCKAPDSQWYDLLDSMLHKVGGAFLFQCNYDLKLLDLKNLPTF